MNLVQNSFTIPFKFKGDPVATGRIEGVQVNRCVLDTGAPTTVMRIPAEKGSFYFDTNSSGLAKVKSLRVEDVEFGPLEVRVKYVDGLQLPELYLGASEMRQYCVTFDYRTKLAEFTTKSLLQDSTEASSISFSRGRPIVTLEMGGGIKRFVLDSGSNGNWLFFHAQTDMLLEEGSVQEKNDIAECGLGNITIQNEFIHPELQIGGLNIKSIVFNLADQNAFGGPTNTLEDGIIGTGYFEPTVFNRHILDFISMRYLIGAKGD